MFYEEIWHALQQFLRQEFLGQWFLWYGKWQFLLLLSQRLDDIGRPGCMLSSMVLGFLITFPRYQCKGIRAGRSQREKVREEDVFPG